MEGRKKIGILEYNFEEYIKQVMDRVKSRCDADVDFIGLRNFDFHKTENFDVIYDMISPFNKYVAEIMKIHCLKGTYLINNPFSISHYNKMLQLNKLVRMGAPIPKSMVLPDVPDKSEEEFVNKPDFDEIVDKFKYPFIMKPYDGWGNCKVFAINSKEELIDAWEQMKRRIMIVQEGIVPADFYRVFIVNKKDTYFLKRAPRFIEGKKYDFNDFSRLTPDIKKYIEDVSIQINKEMGYDLSTIEWSITDEGKAYVIDVNDAPNIADPKKAKEDDLYFPEELYHWIVEKITNMIVEKAGLDVETRKKQMKTVFETI